MFTRRGVLGLMGGLPFTRPDQHYEPPAGGLVPGSRSGILIAKKVVIIAGAGGGLFVYTPTPAFHNLLASTAAVAGTDTYGNAYLAGNATYQTGAGTPVFAEVMSQGATTFYTAASQAGPWTSTGTIGTDNSNNLNLTPSGTGVVNANGGLATPTAVINGNASASPLVHITNNTATPANDTLRVDPAGNTDKAIGVRLTGETNDRWLIQLNATGAQESFGSGSSGVDTTLSHTAANQLSLLTADFDIATAGRGLRIKEGTNARQGTATLVAGVVTVANTSVTANTRIYLGGATPAGSPGALFVSAVTVGTGFTITSSNGSDTSKVAYLLVEAG